MHVLVLCPDPYCGHETNNACVQTRTVGTRLIMLVSRPVHVQHLLYFNAQIFQPLLWLFNMQDASMDASLDTLFIQHIINLCMH